MSEFNLIPGDASRKTAAIFVAAQTFKPTFTHTLEWIDLDYKLASFMNSIFVGIYATDGAGEPTGDYISRNRYLIDPPWQAITFSRIRWSMQAVQLDEDTLYAIVIRGSVPVPEPEPYWSYKQATNPYPRGEALYSTDNGVSWTHYPNDDFIFGEFGTPIAPKPPPEPPIYQHMPLELEQIPTDNGFKIIYRTNVPCHLYMRWTVKDPQRHLRPVDKRGMSFYADLRQCFVVYEDNEQEEAGDTMEHTFIKEPWPYCQTRYFFFWGYTASQIARSTSPIYTKHREKPVYQDILSTYHNRTLTSAHGTWSTARNGYNLKVSGQYQRPDMVLVPHTYLLTLYRLGRSWLFFNTNGLAPVTSAKLGIYVTAKTGLAGAIVITKGLCREPIDEDDWATQTAEVTNLGQFNLADIVLDQYNWAELNQDGLDWINQSALERKQEESFDWGRNAYFRNYGNIRTSESRTPLSAIWLTAVRLRLKRRGSPGTLYVEIYKADANHCPTGSIKAQGTINGNTLSTATWGEWYIIELTAGTQLLANTEYCTVIYAPSGNSSNYVDWIAATGNIYPNGTSSYSTDGGSSWTPYPNYDQYFIDYHSEQIGGTNLCLRADYDVSDTPPIIGADHILTLRSAQHIPGYPPLLRVTT